MKRLLCRVWPWYRRRTTERLMLEYMRRNLQTALDREGLPFRAIINRDHIERRPSAPSSPSQSPRSGSSFDQWLSMSDEAFAARYGAKPRGSAEPDRPAPAAIVAASMRRLGLPSEWVIGEDGVSRLRPMADASRSRSSTGAFAREGAAGSSTSTGTHSADSPIPHGDWSL